MTDGARRWREARRVLAVRLDSIGDVLMTTPAIRALKGSMGRHVALLTSPAGAEVARLVPEVDEIIEYEAPWMKATASRQDGLPDLGMVERLRGEGFDAAAIFTVYSQSALPAALLCFLAGIPLRLAHCRENPYQLLTDWVPDPEPQAVVRHEVRRQLELVAAVGMSPDDHRLSVRVSDAARERVRCLLAARDVDPEGRWVVVHPGASAPSRRYRPEAFAEAARRLVEEAGCEVVFSGTSEEEGLVEGIRAVMEAPSSSLVGLLDLEELAALLELAPLLVANNSGPVHLAAAVETPVVVLYALTNPQHTPWRVRSKVLFHDVPCRYCYKSVCPMGHHDCLRLVPAEAVFLAARELLAAREPLAAPSAAG